VNVVGEPAILEPGDPSERDEGYRGQKPTVSGLMQFTLDIDDASGEAGTRAEKVVAACVGAGLGVRGLDLRGKSLETIFHELTTSDAAETDSPGDKAAPAKDEKKRKSAKRERAAEKDEAAKTDASEEKPS
jgi:hypothetical protein